MFGSDILQIIIVLYPTCGKIYRWDKISKQTTPL